jgi:alkylation response protein AidB-like acyl-CoA dehydrogenase
MEDGMRLALSEGQRRLRAEVRAFAAEEIAPHADGWDREERIPEGFPARLAERGYLGANLAAGWGGRGLDPISYGLLTEEIGRACSSVRSLLTVHDMVGHAIQRWGSREQKERWLAMLVRGETLGAFALSEPNAGSDASGVETTATPDGDDFVLDGHKRWTTFGQIAGLFLVVAKSDGKPTALLVERDRPGLTVQPIQGMLGTRASMLAALRFEGCRVPRENLLGRVGFGVSHVVAAALEHGRYSVAWGAVGLAQACLEAATAYAGERRQFGALLADHQLIRALLADMITHVRAGRLLCCRAGYLRATGDPGALAEIMVAKYFCARMAAQAATDAVQIHGAYGCSAESSVGRYLRDSKILEIIEGSNQIQQSNIPRFSFEEL